MSSRIGRKPIECPTGVEVNVKGQEVTVKGSKGSLNRVIHDLVDIQHEGNELSFVAANSSREAKALTGTSRALVNNMVVGVSAGFEKKLQLIGVGYRAKMQGSKLNLALGFSHPVDMEVPEGLTVETPSQTEIVVKGIDKQKVGQFSSEIRAIRPPEPYKGKGVRYADEIVVRKEAKKK